MAFVTAPATLPIFTESLGAVAFCSSRRCRHAFRAKSESPRASLGTDILASLCVLGANTIHEVESCALVRFIDAPLAGNAYVGETNSSLNDVPQQTIEAPITPSSESDDENSAERDLDTNIPAQSQDSSTPGAPIATPQYPPRNEIEECTSPPTGYVGKSRRSRRGALALGAGALATVLVVRRRSRRMREPCSDDENLKAVTMIRPAKIVPGVSGEEFPLPHTRNSTAFGTEKSTDGDLQDIFSHSRAEWDKDSDGNLGNESENSTNDDNTAGRSRDSFDSTSRGDMNVARSSVYSFSFRTSRARGPPTPQVSDKERKREEDRNTSPKNVKDGSPSVSGGSFQYMRAEFTPDGEQVIEGETFEQVGKPEGRENWSTAFTESADNITRAPSGRKSEVRTEAQVLRGPMTGGELFRRVMGAPLWAVREILVPTWEILSVGWTDARSRLVDILERRDGPFLLGSDALEDTCGPQAARSESAPSNEADSYQEQFHDEEQLSKEEQQVLLFQRAATQAAGHVQSSVKRIIRFFW